ncbi:MAG: DUF4339 domain-containing protein [Planctomycetaceae bacterium]|nr:DUF4339 domain-containing protein [Planctomycetaceae bacterium]
MANWYYYDLMGDRQGPVDSDTLKELAQSGVIVPGTKIETEDGRQSTAGKINGLEFGTPSSPFPVSSPAQAQYEYKCVAAPGVLSVMATRGASQVSDEAKTVASYGLIINRECYDGWEFYSMESINVLSQPGCLAALFGVKAGITAYNMLVFRRQK